LRSAAFPLPNPNVLVGVLTEMKIMSAFSISSWMLFEKNRFLPRHSCTNSSSWGCRSIEKIEFYLWRWQYVCNLLRNIYLIDGQLIAIPLIDSVRIWINDTNSNVWTFTGDHGTSGSSDIAGTNTANLLDGHHFLWCCVGSNAISISK